MAHATNDVPDVSSSYSEAGGRLDLCSVDGSRRRDAPDAAGRLLHELRRLASSSAPEAKLIDGVKRARAGGWSWAPIAVALGCSRAEVIHRFSCGVGHPSTRRARSAGAASGG